MRSNFQIVNIFKALWISEEVLARPHLASSDDHQQLRW